MSRINALSNSVLCNPWNLIFIYWFLSSILKMICRELKPNIRRYAIKPAFKTCLFLVLLSITSGISGLCPIPLLSIGMERFRLDKNLIWHINHVFLPSDKTLEVLSISSIYLGFDWHVISRWKPENVNSDRTGVERIASFWQAPAWMIAGWYDCDAVLDNGNLSATWTKNWMTHDGLTHNCLGVSKSLIWSLITSTVLFTQTYDFN